MKIKLGFAQYPCLEDKQTNLDMACEKITQLAKAGAQVIALQELFTTHYFPQTENAKWFELAESIPGPTLQKISSLARDHKVVVTGSIFEARIPGIYHNTSFVIDDRGVNLGIYRKLHIPDDPCFYEKFYFVPGDLGVRTFATRYGKISTLICWDQWFPEAARIAALQGAQILIYPTAIGWADSEDESMRGAQLDAWMTVQRAHAITNGVYLCAVNRVGREGGLRFWGNSFVTDPHGVVIERVAEDEGITVVECDLGKIQEARHGWPFLRDRRIDVYGDLCSLALDSPSLDEKPSPGKDHD